MSRTSKIIQATGESFSKSIQIAILSGEATASSGIDLLHFTCTHSWVDIETELIGRIAQLCEICDAVYIFPEWVEDGVGVERERTRAEKTQEIIGAIVLAILDAIPEPKKVPPATPQR